MTVPANLPWAIKYPASVDWAAPIAARPLCEIFDDAVRAYPENVFLDFLGKTTTYRAAADFVARAAKGLQDLGVIKGDRVGLMLPNSPYYVFLYFAALKIGATVVNFNPLYAASEIKNQVRDSGCKIMATLDMPSIYGKLNDLVGQGDFQKIVVCRMADALPTLLSLLYPIVKHKDVVRVKDDAFNIDFKRLTANDGTFTPASINPTEDLAVLQYTGGTTGVPKGAMLTHANLSINVVQTRRIFPSVVQGKEVMLGVLPFFHVFAMTAVMNVTISLASKIILLPRFELKQVIKTIDKKRPTLFPAVPTIYTAINHFPQLADYNLRSLKFCFSGGAPLPTKVKSDFEILTGCVVVEGYGLSETSPVVSCNPVDGENKAGSIGLPAPLTYIDIIDPDTKQKLPQGDVGEICIRGPQVMKGYWHQADETAMVLVSTAEGTYLRTGDLGHMDKEGYIFIDDRLKDMIAAGGFKIYPTHVEEAIYKNQAVEECIVAGLPDDYRGETVGAFIKLRAGFSLSADDLKTFLKEKLSPMEMPKEIVFYDKPLPRTLIGKLSRKIMLEQYAKEQAGEAKP